MSLKPILVHVSSGSWAALQADAARQGVSTSRLVRDAIEHHFVSGQVIVAKMIVDGSEIIGQFCPTGFNAKGVR